MTLGGGENEARTTVLVVSVNEHVPFPAQAVLSQPTKLWLAPGVAVRLTTVPEAKVAWQTAPQLMPAGVLATVPMPTLLIVKVSV
jgi:hypothetical protein